MMEKINECESVFVSLLFSDISSLTSAGLDEGYEFLNEK